MLSAFPDLGNPNSLLQLHRCGLVRAGQLPMKANPGVRAKGLRETCKESVFGCRREKPACTNPSGNYKKDNELGAKSARRKGTVKSAASRHHRFLN